MNFLKHKGPSSFISNIEKNNYIPDNPEFKPRVRAPSQGYSKKYETPTRTKIENKQNMFTENYKQPNEKNYTDFQIEKQKSPLETNKKDSVNYQSLGENKLYYDDNNGKEGINLNLNNQQNQGTPMRYASNFQNNYVEGQINSQRQPQLYNSNPIIIEKKNFNRNPPKAPSEYSETRDTPRSRGDGGVSARSRRFFSGSKRDRSNEILAKYGIKSGNSQDKRVKEKNPSSQEESSLAKHYKFLMEKEKQRVKQLETELTINKSQIESLKEQNEFSKQELEKNVKMLEETLRIEKTEKDKLLDELALKEEKLEEFRNELNKKSQVIKNWEKVLKKNQKDFEIVNQNMKEIKKNSISLLKLLKEIDNDWTPEMKDDYAVVKTAMQKAYEQINEFKKELGLSESQMMQSLNSKIHDENYSSPYDELSLKKTIATNKKNKNRLQFSLTLIDRMFAYIDDLNNDFDNCVIQEGQIDTEHTYYIVKNYLDECEKLRNHNSVQKLLGINI